MPEQSPSTVWREESKKGPQLLGFLVCGSGLKPKNLRERGKAPGELQTSQGECLQVPTGVSSKDPPTPQPLAAVQLRLWGGVGTEYAGSSYAQPLGAL